MAPELPTLVLVDDAAEVRSLIRTHLRLSRRFSIVGEASSGVEAVALADQHRPALMLLDVSMPRMDGLEALPRVLAVSPATRVVLYSGFDERGLAEHGTALGAAGFVEKSVPLSELADRLEALSGSTAGGADLRAEDRRTGAARVLGEHLERFREVFEQAAIGMAILTLTGRVVRVNRQLVASLGTGPEAVVGQPYADLSAPSSAEELTRAVVDLAEGRVAVRSVEHALDRPGGAGVVVSTISSVRDEHEQPLYLFVQAQDVTAERAAAEQLRQSEERFRLLVEAVKDYAIFMLDPHGHVVSWNAGAQRTKGWTADEIVGQHFRRFYPPEVQQSGHPERELELALRDGHYEEEGWRVRKDGSTFWASVVITTVRNADGEHVGFAKVTRDVTERRLATVQRERAAQALAAARDELARTNVQLARAAADRADFLAVTAHELRGPVGVLGGSAATLAQHWADVTEEERAELFEGMVSSAGRVRRLLSDLLMAARLEAGAVELECRPVPVRAALITAAAAAGHHSPGDEIRVEADEHLHVRADPDRFARIVENLLANALSHGAAPVQVRAVADDGRVVVRVSDAGPGVPADLADRVFERFATGNRRGGTGLGLHIVRELARAQGGEAWYEPARAGSGAAFAVALPEP